MTEAEIVEFIATELGGVEVMVASAENAAPEVAWGDTFFFYRPHVDPGVDPGGGAPVDHRFPFATIVTKDYEGSDTESNLNRDGVYRLNIGVSGQTFQRLFPGFGTDTYDYAALDTPVPHPVYGQQRWVSVLNPGPRAWPVAKELLQEAFQRAAASHAQRAAR